MKKRETENSCKKKKERNKERKTEKEESENSCKKKSLEKIWVFDLWTRNWGI